MFHVNADIYCIHVLFMFIGFYLIILSSFIYQHEEYSYLTLFNIIIICNRKLLGHERIYSHP